MQLCLTVLQFIRRYDEILETIKLKIGRQYFSNCYTHMAIDDPKV